MNRSQEGWTTFSTALGVCGLSWNAKGLTSFSLPQASTQDVEKHLQKNAGCLKACVPPSWVKELIQQVKLHCKGEAQDFSKVPVYFDGVSSFTRSVYAAAQKIPSGKVVTYGKLAARISRPGAARAVGSALAKNPIPLIVPCHRVLGSSGKLGGFSAYGGLRTKAALLYLEGVEVGTD